MTIGTEDFLVVFDIAEEKKANPPNPMCLVKCTDNCAKGGALLAACCHSLFYSNLFAIVRCRASKAKRGCHTVCHTGHTVVTLAAVV